MSSHTVPWLAPTLVLAALFAWRTSCADTTPDSVLVDMTQPVVAEVGSLSFRTCRLEVQGRDRLAQCAWLSVPEDYAQPEGRQLQLLVARLPAQKPKGPQAPVLFLAGGPGQSATQTFLFIDRNLSGLAKDRDFYLIDQRGTGHSNRLSCDRVIADAEQVLSFESDSVQQLDEFVQQCLAELPGDPRFYTTSVAIRDFERARAALDLPQWNLLGVSYGTRVALHYMRRHTQAVRSAVLDSVVPPDLPLVEDIPLLSQQTLNHLYLRCEQEHGCRENFPDLRDRVETLLTRLDKGPIEVQAESLHTGQIENIQLKRAHLVLLIRMYLYHTQSLAVLPAMLYESAERGNLAPLARATKATLDSTGGLLALGMHNAVMCTEDTPYIDLESAQSQHESTYMGAKWILNLHRMCASWPPGERDEDFKTPVVSAIPTLLLSGEQDPITPPAYGDQAARTLSHSRHLVLPGQGHFVSTTGCAPQVIEQFVRNASVHNINSQCLSRLQAAPLFINFNGPSP